MLISCKKQIIARTNKMSFQNKPPLCVDLDGTLIYSDTLAELFLRMIKKRPCYLIFLPFWLLRGRAFLKIKMEEICGKYVKHIPFNDSFLKYLNSKKAEGHKLYLATACPKNLAKKLVESLNLFEEVWGSSSEINLKSAKKAELLLEKFGENNFIYAGNDAPDLEVWRHAQSLVLVNVKKSLERKAAMENPTKNILVFSEKKSAFKAFFRATRIHQWAKNILIFVPLFLSHSYFKIDKIGEALLAFLAFGLCASASYIFNDIMDVENDRLHASKRRRPIAAGHFSIASALIIAFSFMAISVLISAVLSVNTLLVLLLYTALTLSYSFYFKRIVLLDIIILSSLYMIRIYYGSTAISVATSFWLMSFSIFIFFSLGFMKRYIELQKMENTNEKIKGRGYVYSDAQIIAPVGIASGILSLVFYVIYVDKVAFQLYERPSFLMFGAIIFLYFIVKTWIMAARKLVHDDPIVYAIKTKENYAILILFIFIFIISGPK